MYVRGVESSFIYNKEQKLVYQNSRREDSLPARKSSRKRSIFDNTIVMWKKKNELIGIMCIHVDDLCFGGNEEFEEKVINIIRKKLQTGPIEQKSFKYVGINIV